MVALIAASNLPGARFSVAEVYGHEASPALLRARELGIQTKEFTSSDQLVEMIRKTKVKIIALAGYLSLLPIQEIDRPDLLYVNIHPALLPKFGGKGMFGNHVHEAVLRSGETVSGATVHYVNERYDEGNIVLQRSCSVFQTDTITSLASRVLEQEHLLYPEAIEKIILEKQLDS